MAAPSRILYELHHSIEPNGFENLCVDLLCREGYSRIVPAGKRRDHGRDAEIRFWLGNNAGAPRIAFQFSMEVRWEAKLRKDIVKITRYRKTIEEVIFVSNRVITPEKQDKLRDAFIGSHKIKLQIFDQEWLRIRLEEAHTDLAFKHLGIKLDPTPGFYCAQVCLHGLTDENCNEMLRHTTPEALRANFTAQTLADPSSITSWKGLAAVASFQSDFETALPAISKALELARDEIEILNLNIKKALILADRGIKNYSRVSLKEAHSLLMPFASRLNRAVDHYNMGNILGALKEREEAESYYRRCLDIDPAYAPAWQNLGSLLVAMRRREEGLQCLDRALALKPDLVPALCSKANILVMTEDDCTEALELMAKAFTLEPNLDNRWPYARYWHAMALCRNGRFVEAMAEVRLGLQRHVDCPYLRKLATDLLAKLWRSDSSFISEAEAFFSLRIDPEVRDYQIVIAMLDLLEATGREAEAWKLLDRLSSVNELTTRSIANRIPISLSELVESFNFIEFYYQYRKNSPLFEYARMFDGLKLRPHPDVPEILFHLLIPSFVKLRSALLSSTTDSNDSTQIDTFIDVYCEISKVVAAFGGFLLSEKEPEGREQLPDLLFGAVTVGMDIPLIELSRMLGFVGGQTGQEIHESYRHEIVSASKSIHDKWITNFFDNLAADWNH